MNLIYQLLNLGKALASAKFWSILATGLVLLALWGSINEPTTTGFYFGAMATVLIIAVLVYLLPKLPQ